MNNYYLINNLLDDYSDASILKLNTIINLKSFDLAKIKRCNLVKFFKLYLYNRECYENFTKICKQNMHAFLTYKIADDDHKLEFKKKYGIPTTIERISFIDETPKEIIKELKELFPYILPTKEQ